MYRPMLDVAKFFSLLSLVCFGLMACSSDPIISDLDILEAENKHTLPALYDRLQADKKKAKPSSDWGISVRRNLETVGKKIALQKEQEIIASLQAEKIIYDTPTLLSTHDISTLDFSLKKAADIEKYNKEIYYSLVRQLEKAINDKKIQVKVKETEFNRLSNTYAVKKYQLLDEIAFLSGGEQADKIEEQKATYLKDLYVLAEDALKVKRYEDVLLHLTSLETIQADYPGLDTLRDSLHAEELEQQFWDALGEGDTDRAYAFFFKLSKIPIYMDNNHSIKPIAEDIAKYFLVQGKSALSTYNLAETYKAFSRVRYIRQVLGSEAKYDPSEKEFISFLVSRIKLFMSNKEIMHAYGFLSVLEEMDASHALLAELSPTVNASVHQDAAMKLILSKVSQRGENTDFAELINRQLQSELPKLALSRIQLINESESGQFKVASINDDHNSIAYHVFNAEILALELNAVSAEHIEIKNVITGAIRVENPEYIQWQQLSSRAKRGETEPSSTMMKDVKSDINIKHLTKKKKIESSITYRVNTIMDSKVLVSDALSEIILHEAKETEALRLGDFEQKAITAELPSDEGVRLELATLLVKNMSNHIVKSIDVMEEKYTDKAQAAYVAKQYQLATHYFAYRNVLNHSQNKSNADVLAGLRNSAMNWQ